MGFGGMKSCKKERSHWLDEPDDTSNKNILQDLITWAVNGMDDYTSREEHCHMRCLSSTMQSFEKSRRQYIDRAGQDSGREYELHLKR